MSRIKVESEQTSEYFNFINSINSEQTKKQYAYCLNDFLAHCNVDLHCFLILTIQEKEKLIIEYLVQKKVSASYKNAILATIKHACDMNDVILNWKKIKKFSTSQRTGNEIAGRDRGYYLEEIQKILQHSEQRIKTAFLILASTGIRIGALAPLKIRDLEKIDDSYKITVYSGYKEQYITFCTHECAKEIDSYLQFRTRRGEHITGDSHLLVKKFRQGFKTEGFKEGYSLRAVLQDNIENTGLRNKGSKFKRKETQLLHAFRKFFTKQLVDSNVKAEIREMLLGHKIGLTSIYYKPTEQEMLNEYYKAVPLLTISDEERLRFKLEEHVRIEKTRMDAMREDMDKFKAELAALKRKRK